MRRTIYNTSEARMSILNRIFIGQMVAEKCYKHPFKIGMTKIEILSAKSKAKV